MSKKEKTVKTLDEFFGLPEGEEHYPIYIQSSNPSDRLLNWACEMSKKTIVYFQSGSPIPPPPPPPGDE